MVSMDTAGSGAAAEGRTRQRQPGSTTTADLPDTVGDAKRQLVAVLLSNRSAASMSLGQPNAGAGSGTACREAQSDAKWCVKLAPRWAKGYNRLGTALAGDPEGRWGEAIAAFEEGLEIEPGNQALRDGLLAATPHRELEFRGA